MRACGIAPLEHRAALAGATMTASMFDPRRCLDSPASRQRRSPYRAAARPAMRALTWASVESFTWSPPSRHADQWHHRSAKHQHVVSSRSPRTSRALAMETARPSRGASGWRQRHRTPPTVRSATRPVDPPSLSAIARARRPAATHVNAVTPSEIAENAIAIHAATERPPETRSRVLWRRHVELRQRPSRLAPQTCNSSKRRTASTTPSRSAERATRRHRLDVPRLALERSSESAALSDIAQPLQSFSRQRAGVTGQLT